MADDRLAALIRQRDAAGRALERFDAADKGSRWATHSEEGATLAARYRALDAEVEAAAGEEPDAAGPGMPCYWCGAVTPCCPWRHQ